MILEHAVLNVIPGQEDEFELAFAEAKLIISSAQGFRSLRLLHCLEAEHRYLLLVEWETLEDHTQGFRGSEIFANWKALLHHFYDPFPTVEHFNTVVEI
jgi:heme-degrading monooxygenase HmoA